MAIALQAEDTADVDAMYFYGFLFFLAHVVTAAMVYLVADSLVEMDATMAVAVETVVDAAVQTISFGSSFLLPS